MTKPTTTNERKRAAKYKRISDDREGDELGVTRQDEDLNALAERLGVEIVADYIDNDLSASSKARKVRPDYIQMLADARAGEFDMILAYTSSRITRRPREHEDLIDLSEQHGITFAYVRSPSFDLNTADGRQVARMLAAADAGEAERTAERVQRAARQRAEQGKISGGGTRPFGYEADFKTVREDEAELLRGAVERILNNGETIYGLCKEWNGKGIKTVTGKLWLPIIFKRMLVSARISGRREHKRVKHLGTITATAEWPAIISPEDSDRLRELLTDPARTTNTDGAARKYYLTGFLFCHCGEKMRARPYPNRARSCVCVSSTLGAHTRIHAEKLELYVMEAALDYLDEFVNLASAIRTDSTDTREAELWQSLANYQQRLEELQSAFYVHRRMDQRTFDRLSVELDIEVERTKSGIAKVSGQRTATNLPTSSEQARALWEARGFEWRRMFIKTLVKRVTIGPGIRGLNKFDPRRVSIVYQQPE